MSNKLKNLCELCPGEIRGICCYYLTIIEDHLVYLPNHPCKFFDLKSKRCTIYENRHEINPNCLTLEEMYYLGSLPKKCPYILEDIEYQNNEDSVVLDLPGNITNKGMLDFHETNNQEHSKVGCYDIIRSPICPKCKSKDIEEELIESNSISFYRYECESCEYEWNNLKKQLKFNKKRNWIKKTIK